MQQPKKGEKNKLESVLDATKNLREVAFKDFVKNVELEFQTYITQNMSREVSSDKDYEF